MIVGDVDTDEALKNVEKHFGSIRAGHGAAARQASEPEQQAERRLVSRKPGTTAYWKAAFHAPSFEDESFFPLLIADAVLNGAGGLNIWSGGGVPRPQRSARLYRALVEKGLTSSVSGALMPTQHPFSICNLRAAWPRGNRSAALTKWSCRRLIDFARTASHRKS